MVKLVAMSLLRGISSAVAVSIVIAIIAVAGAAAYTITLQPTVLTQTKVQTQVQTQTVEKVVTVTPPPQAPKQLQKVKFHLAWVVGESDAGYLTAIEKGYYADEGIQVEFTPSTKAGIQLQLVASGEYDLGLATGPEVIATRASGAKVVALTMMYQNFPSGTYSLPKNPVKGPKDLEGKKVGVIPNVIEYFLFLDVLKRAGVDQSKISETAISFNVVAPLATGQVDAVRGWLNDKFSFIQNGYPDVLFWHWGKDTPAYASGIFATEDFLKKNEDLAKRFVRASIKGWYYAAKHRGEAIDFILKYTPETNRLALTSKLDAVLDGFVITDTTKTKGLGWMEVERWDSTQKIIFDAGQIKQTIDPTLYFTTKYLPGVVEVP